MERIERGGRGEGEERDGFRKDSANDCQVTFPVPAKSCAAVRKKRQSLQGEHKLLDAPHCSSQRHVQVLRCSALELHSAL
jgi:hypothetical protein